MDGEGIRRETDDRNIRGGSVFERVRWWDAWRAFKELICNAGNGFCGG